MLHLNKVTFFDDFNMAFTPGLNVLVGENATGKTQILKFIYALCDREYEHEWCESGKQVIYHPNDNSLQFLFGFLFDRAKAEVEHIRAVFTDTTVTAHTAPHFFNVEEGMDLDKIDHPFFGAEPDAINTNVPLIVTWPSFTPGSRVKCTLIPDKDMISHAKGLVDMYRESIGDFPIRQQYIDIIAKATKEPQSEDNALVERLGEMCSKLLNGDVAYENESFFIVRADGKKIPFDMEAEGFKRIALLWRLLQNKTITPGSILLWDEPDANINPANIAPLVEILLELQRCGVQIVLTTHNYLLAKYFDLRKRTDDAVMFTSMYKVDGKVLCEQRDSFRGLEHNSIMEAYTAMLDEVYEVE